MKKQLSQNLIFSLLMMTLGAYVNVFHTVVDRMALAMGREATASGLLISTFALGSLVSVMLSSALSDRIGKRLVITSALVVMALGFFLLNTQAGSALVPLGLFLFGFGFAPAEAQASAILGDENPRTAARWMNISQAGFSLGAIAGPLLAMAFLASNPAYQGLFLISAGMSLGFLLLILFSAGTRLRPPQDAPHHSLNMFSVLKNTRLRYLALIMFLYLGYESVSPAYIKQMFLRAGESETLAATMISLFWATMIVGRLIGTALTGRELPSIRVFTLFVIAGVLLLIWAATTPIRILAVGLIGFGCGPVWPMLVVRAVQLVPERSGAVMGLMLLCSMAGITFFPPVIGTLPGNLNATFILCAILAVLVIAITTWAIKVFEQEASA